MAYTTIDDPSAHFQALSYSGGSGSLARTFDGNSDLQPDLTWHKSRGQTYDHYLFDSTRGVGLYLKSNAGVPDDGSSGDTTSITSFDSDGFTLPGGTGISDPSAAIMCWGWKANGGTRTTNTESGNNPAGGYQANTTAGFSIVDYTGTGAVGTMAHGLGATPDMIWVKNRDQADSWSLYFSALGPTEYFLFDTYGNSEDDNTNWNDQGPTSSVFTIGTSHKTNADGEKYIAYCFTNIQGYSKAGKYIGTGNTNGPFIYLGFKPAWLLVKMDGNGESWNLLDNKRNTHNPANTRLDPDTNSAEVTDSGYAVDFLSNGFKPRNNGGDFNTDGSTYYYAAFAEQPFVSSEGVPCTAR